MKWYDWLPIYGMITSVYKQVKCKNGFIMLLWFILQSISILYLVEFIYILLNYYYE